MLYVTTRNDTDVYTAIHALRGKRGIDGGLYVPFRSPDLSGIPFESLSVNETLCRVLNLLFRTKMTPQALDYRLGKQILRVRPLGQRIDMAELWSLPARSYDLLEQGIYSELVGEEAGLPGNWARIAIRAALLCAVFGEIQRMGHTGVMDVSVAAGDFSAPISAWYAKQWGLPIGRIVCCCNENSGVWDLLNHGQMRTDTVAVKSAVPEADVAVPENLERLIFACGGAGETERYLDCCRLGRVYVPSEATAAGMKKGLFASVISDSRIGPTIVNGFSTHGYVLTPHGALAYGGLADYRAKVGQTRQTIVLAEKCPMEQEAELERILGLEPKSLRSYI